MKQKTDQEPTMLFHGKNRLAVPLLVYYRTLCREDGCAVEVLQHVDAIISDFEAYRDAHPELMTQPLAPQLKGGM